jgi:hypothetical protein
MKNKKVKIFDLILTLINLIFNIIFNIYKYHYLSIIQPQRGEMLIAFNQHNRIRTPFRGDMLMFLYFITGSKFSTINMSPLNGVRYS